MGDDPLAGRDRKMMFHPRAERPTEPNAGILRLEPGAHHPLHYHDFAQVWYVLEGTFPIGGRECAPGNHDLPSRSALRRRVPHRDRRRDPDRPVSRARPPAAGRSTTIASICRSGERSRPSASTARSAREIALAALAGRVQEHRFVFAQPLQRGGHDVARPREAGLGLADPSQNLFVGKPFVE